jgi:hypothetical protein
MPRMPVPAFLDPSNTGDSVAQSVSRTVNFYHQAAQPGTARSPRYPRRTPCVTPVATWPAGPIRGMFATGDQAAGNERCFIVGGGQFGELTPTMTIINTGVVTTDAYQATLCGNGSAGHQVFIVSGGSGYIFDTNANTLTHITDPDFPISSAGEFVGGYFLALEAASRKVQFSALENGLTWDALDVFERSYASDDIATIIRSHTELWVLGLRTSEVWVMNVAGGNNPWVPQTGVLIEHGAQPTGWTAQRVDNALMWMGRNDDGLCIVWRSNGYTPQRVSTFAVESWLQQTTVPNQVIGFVMQLGGHIFYHLLAPDLPTTWVYDVTMDLWHEWAIWDPVTSRFYPHVAQHHLFVFQQHLVGSRLDGTIYRCDTSILDDTITGSLV